MDQPRLYFFHGLYSRKGYDGAITVDKNWNHLIIGWVEEIGFLTSGILFIFEWSLLRYA